MDKPSQFIVPPSIGVGIALKDQAKVFEKFGQGRHAHVPKERGTGLGLSIVRGLIHAHGAEIGLESVEHEGTTMTVTLPACRIIRAEAIMPSPRLFSETAPQVM